MVFAPKGKKFFCEELGEEMASSPVLTFALSSMLRRHRRYVQVLPQYSGRQVRYDEEFSIDGTDSFIPAL